jgi:hypothetical protein
MEDKYRIKENEINNFMKQIDSYSLTLQTLQSQHTVLKS